MTRHYLDAGRNLLTTSTRSSPTGPAATTTFAYGDSYTYNTAGDLTKATNPAGKDLQFSYTSQHWMTTQTDERGKVTTNTFQTSNSFWSQSFGHWDRSKHRNRP